jgi:hypothetical protein
MIDANKFTSFSLSNKFYTDERDYTNDCGLKVKTTIEYCETEKGIHFIITYDIFGAFKSKAKVHNILTDNHTIMINLLELNAKLNPTATGIYELSKIENFNINRLLENLSEFNKYSTELDAKVVPLGYKISVVIIPVSGIGILNKLIVMLPSNGSKVKVLTFKSLSEAESTLNIIRTYGTV